MKSALRAGLNRKTSLRKKISPPHGPVTYRIELTVTVDCQKQKMALHVVYNEHMIAQYGVPMCCDWSNEN